MCGLAAILARRNARVPADVDGLDRISAAMTARGPDGHGRWVSPDGSVGLAHRRLSIIDLSQQAAQPMVAEDGALALVFNGEIYNYQSLRRDLEAQGTVFRTHSDTEVIMHLYRRDGLEMLKHLRGMFAIALWDERAKTLMLARDPFGIKPLYVADDGRTLKAASQVKALLAGGGIDTTPNPAGHAGFFLWGHVPEPHTLYRGIVALPAGSWLVADHDGRVQRGRFFDLTEELATAQAAPRPDSDTLHAALLDSVVHHLVADVPVGLFLSGGLDSTTLAALVHEASGRPPVTVTLGFSEFQGGPRDEAALAERMAASIGADHVTSRVGGSDFAASRAQILNDMDQPSIDGVNTWLVARAVRERGLKVALSGLGGDELFGGYDTFRQVPRLVHALSPFGMIRPLAKGLRVLTATPARRLGRPKAAGLLEYGSNFGAAYVLRRCLFAPWEISRVLDHDLARQGLSDLSAEESGTALTRPIFQDRLKITALETAFYMRNQLLRDSDWAGMAHGVEIRTPLVDLHLFRTLLPLLASSSPPGKLDMAGCAQPPLPAEIRHRPKTGFFVPIPQWMGEVNLRGWASAVYRAFQTPPTPAA